MGLSNTEAPDAGFATSAATMVALALAIIATAATANAIMELRAARSDFGRARASYLLDGAHQLAALGVLNAKPFGRLAWRMSVDGAPVSVLAEAESQKLNVADAETLSGALLARLGVADAQALQTRLDRLVDERAPDAAIEGADAAPLWRSCARSIVSFYGQAAMPILAPAQAPKAGYTYGLIGETWRLRLASVDGWVDDRIVRFTGDALRPTATVERRFTRGGGGEAPCESLFAARPGT